MDLRMGTFSKSLASCGGFVAGPADVIEYLRLYSRAFLFTASAVPAALGAALGALRVMRSADGPPLLARVLERAWRLRDGLADLGFAVVSPQPLPPRPGIAAAPGVRPDAAGAPTIVTPIVPVLVGDDWKAALLWRALYDGGVFVNTALHPAVPPGGRAAAHQRDGHPRRRNHRPRPVRLCRRQARVRGRARPAAGPGLRRRPARVGGAGVTFLTRLHPDSGLVHFFTSRSGDEKGRC